MLYEKDLEVVIEKVSEASPEQLKEIQDVIESALEGHQGKSDNYFM